MADRLDHTVKPYEVFDLRVTKAGRSYRVSASSVVGQAEGSFPLPVPFEEVDALLAALELPPAEALARVRPWQPSTRKMVASVGGRLYGALFAKEVGALFAAGRARAIGAETGLRIRLDLGGVPELARWPWELLYDSKLKRFLAIAAGTPIVRSLPLPLASPPLGAGLPLAILLVVAAPIDQPKLRSDREIERIEEALAPLLAAQQVTIDRLQPATLDALRRRLQASPVHILHFIGHGSYDREQNEGWLYFEDEQRKSVPVEGSLLGATLLGRPPRLVVLNACDGARHGATDAFDGVAQTLLLSSIPAVVAMQLVVPDRAALTFAERFYASLVEGHPVDAAVAEARLALAAKHRHFRWVAPVLYLRSPDGRLFDLAESAPKPPPKRRFRLILLLAIVPALAVLSLWLWVRSQGESENEAVHRRRQQTKALQSPKCPAPEGSDILFVPIDPGTFEMGSDRAKEKGYPAHQVTISQPFCMGAYEVTVAEWDQVMGGGEHLSSADGELPMVDVTKKQAEEFVARLTQKNRGRRFFLPTEAQWEYSARGGSAATYSFGNDLRELYRYANCGEGKGGVKGGPGHRTPIGTYPANGFGLSDMEGNVSEWVEDFFGPYPDHSVTDPTGPVGGDHYIVRGGSFEHNPETCGLAYRVALTLKFHRTDIGFRIAATPLP